MLEERSIQIMPHHQRRIHQRHHQRTQHQQLKISSWGKWNREISTGGPCMYGFRASILLPHLSSSRPDTYLNHSGRATDPFWKKTFFFQQKVTFWHFETDISMPAWKCNFSLNISPILLMYNFFVYERILTNKKSK